MQIAEERSYLLSQKLQTLVRRLRGQPRPANFQVRHVIRALRVQLLKLAGNCFRAADDKVDWMPTEVLGPRRFRDACGNFAFLPEAPPQRSQGGLDLLKCRRLVAGDEERPVGRHQPTAARGVKCGDILAVLLRGPQM